MADTPDRIPDLRVIDHGDYYEFCEWESGIYQVADAMKGLEDKPIVFSIDVLNENAMKFYRALLSKGKIRMKSIICEVVK